MKTLQRAVNAICGIRYLFAGRFATPRRHRGKLRRWPEDTTIPEADIRDILEAWTEQQEVAWTLARVLAWAALVRGLWSALGRVR